MAYLTIDTLVIDDETGEIIDAAGIDDPLKFVAQKRHEAAQQMKEWEELRRNYDRVLLRNQELLKVTYGDVVIARRSSSYPVFQALDFGSMLADLELTAEERLQILFAAKGFTREMLPEVAQPLLDKATEHRQKQPWIESSIARKVAPKATQAVRDD